MSSKRYLKMDILPCNPISSNIILLMNITEKIIRKLKSAGVEKAEAHAEVITEVLEDVLEMIPTKDYVDNQFAQQAATNGQFHTETQAELENQRTKRTEDRSETQIGFTQINAKIDSGFARMETRFAEQDQKNTELRAEMETGFAKQDQKNTKLRAEMETGFANQDQKNTELRAEMLAGFANQTAMLKSSQFSLLRWTVGSIFVIIGFLATLIYFLLRQGPS